MLPYVDVATGSLGQGLPIGVGMALNGKYLDKLPYRVWVLLGDSEMAEGSIWEAFDKASYYKLDNLIGILDMNRLGQRGETDLGWNSAAYAARARAFGWHAIELDGHDLDAIDARLCRGAGPEGPADLPDRQDGEGARRLVRGQQGRLARQGADAEQAKNGHRRAGRRAAHHRADAQAGDAAGQPPGRREPLKLPTYDVGSKEATRKAYGDALVALGAVRPDVVALDGEVSNSTHADEFKKAYPDRFFEMFIAEQQLVAAAVGLASWARRRSPRRSRPSSPAPTTRSAWPPSPTPRIHLVRLARRRQHRRGRPVADGPGRPGHDAGRLRQHRAVSLRRQPDRPAGQADGGPARASPSCGPRARRRRSSTRPSEKFPVGGSKLVRHSDKDRVAVDRRRHHAARGAEGVRQLKAEGIAIRVIDAYSVKPIDAKTLHQAAKDTGGKLVVVEDHWLEGGLGDAVLDAFAGSRGR